MRDLEKKLKSLADNWKRERLIEEESSKQFLGFTKNAEIINGRLAMFFLTTGLLCCEPPLAPPLAGGLF